MTVLAYHELEDEDEVQGFVPLEHKPGGLMIKEMTLPGAFGYRYIVIRHLKRDKPGAEPLLVISYTHTEPDRAKRRRILREAEKFLGRSGRRADA